MSVAVVVPVDGEAVAVPVDGEAVAVPLDGVAVAVPAAGAVVVPLAEVPVDGVADCLKPNKRLRAVRNASSVGSGGGMSTRIWPELATGDRQWPGSGRRRSEKDGRARVWAQDRMKEI